MAPTVLLGSFRGLVQRGLAIELSDNLRQVHAWERRALDHIREGRASQALALYDEHGRIAVEPSDAQTRERMVDDWLGAGDPDQAVMVAHRRVDVAELDAWRALVSVPPVLSTGRSSTSPEDGSRSATGS